MSKIISVLGMLYLGFLRNNHWLGPWLGVGGTEATTPPFNVSSPSGSSPENVTSYMAGSITSSLASTVPPIDTSNAFQPCSGQDTVVTIITGDYHAAGLTVKIECRDLPPDLHVPTEIEPFLNVQQWKTTAQFATTTEFTTASTESDQEGVGGPALRFFKSRPPVEAEGSRALASVIVLSFVAMLTLIIISDVPTLYRHFKIARHRLTRYYMSKTVR